jgi:poly(ADP-ribose) glycohydrolase ARH3
VTKRLFALPGINGYDKRRMAGSMRSVINSKFRGCLLGGLIGDCIGSPFEGDKIVVRGALVSYFERLLSTGDDKSTRSLQIYPYSDDTAMMKSVASSLIRQHPTLLSEGFDDKDLAKRFCMEYFKQPRRGYGSGVVELFHHWRESDYENLESAKYSFGGCGSLGNGAAMRIAPVTLYAHAVDMTTEQLVHLVKKISLLTHTHPLGVNGAVLQALAIKGALETKISMDKKCDRIGEPFNTTCFLDKLISQMKPIEERTPIVTPPKQARSDDRINRNSIELSDSSETPYTDKLVQIKTILEDKTQGSNLSNEEIASQFGNSVSAFRSVPSALLCALSSLKQEKEKDLDSENPFVKCLFLSISLGGDTDTIASMACSIVGAFLGEGALHPILIKRCEFSQEAAGLADSLTAFYGS